MEEWYKDICKRIEEPFRSEIFRRPSTIIHLFSRWAWILVQNGEDLQKVEDQQSPTTPRHALCLEDTFTWKSRVLNLEVKSLSLLPSSTPPSISEFFSILALPSWFVIALGYYHEITLPLRYVSSVSLPVSTQIGSMAIPTFLHFMTRATWRILSILRSKYSLSLHMIYFLSFSSPRNWDLARKLIASSYFWHDFGNYSTSPEQFDQACKHC